jgi:GST-like protein
MFQMGGVGPMFGQAHHFLHYAPEDIDYACERYSNEAGRLYGVMDQRLGEKRFLAGDDYTIADMASFPWALNPGRKEQKPSDFPNVMRWIGEIESRPAVKIAMQVLSAEKRDLAKGMDEETRKNLFGSAQYQKH